MGEITRVHLVQHSAYLRRGIKIGLAVLIVVILAALIVPAVLVARDAARRAQSFG